VVFRQCQIGALAADRVRGIVPTMRTAVLLLLTAVPAVAEAPISAETFD
jgi:hypothetical protein